MTNCPYDHARSSEYLYELYACWLQISAYVHNIDECSVLESWQLIFKLMNEISAQHITQQLNWKICSTNKCCVLGLIDLFLWMTEAVWCWVNKRLVEIVVGVNVFDLAVINSGVVSIGYCSRPYQYCHCAIDTMQCVCMCVCVCACRERCPSLEKRKRGELGRRKRTHRYISALTGICWITTTCWIVTTDIYICRQIMHTSIY